MWDDRYANDPIAAMKPRRGPAQRERVTLTRGLVLEHSTTEFCGAVVGVREGVVQLEDFGGALRSFPLSDGFLVDGRPVELAMPTRAPQKRVTASGSVAVAPQRARVAMPSRIFVEGKHDAELVEQVWGDDLRVEGVVVELLDGADNLEQVLAEFGPGPGRRAGVLLDHLVAGSKETRIAERVARGAGGAHVLIVGHPFVDIWAAVKPERLGLQAWPEIPRMVDGRPVEWKAGICRALGWPADEPADIADAWSRIRGRVRSYRDLEPSLLGRVEQLIDFVTDPEQGSAG
ncbi:hypothetical protein LEUCIP111803_01574 [Leucobacter soli]|uniref:DUF3097 domain-containing protein n=3 Tax=Leucobacter soli TaxID=2812850 RepID=A0A916JX84_9MICO|nr:DUF3097 family protein [Leucobacter soli]CAG7612507.1 hypothetical protein LEUCIP111803_01574 [Leucobacter soli]